MSARSATIRRPISKSTKRTINLRYGEHGQTKTEAVKKAEEQESLFFRFIIVRKFALNPGLKPNDNPFTSFGVV